MSVFLEGGRRTRPPRPPPLVRRPLAPLFFSVFLTVTLGRSASSTRPVGLARRRATAAARAGPPVASAAAATKSARRGSAAAPMEAATARAARWRPVSGVWVG